MGRHDQLGDVPPPADADAPATEVMEAPPRRFRLSRKTTLFLVAVLGLLFLVGSTLYAQRDRDVADSRAQNAEGRAQSAEGVATDEATKKRQLAEQVQQACDAKDFSGPICQRADQVAEEPLPGPTGPAGAAGTPGSPGATGTAGEPGQPGTQGAQGTPGVPGVTGGEGQAGRPGDPGQPGTPGATGATGPSGPAGPEGPTGPAGPQGVAGQNGENGSPGAIGPQGLPGAPPDTQTFNGINGQTYSCSRSGGSDSAPTYTCTASGGSGDEEPPVTTQNRFAPMPTATPTTAPSSPNPLMLPIAPSPATK